MRKITALIIFTAIVLTGCVQTNEPGEQDYYISIDVESGFLNDAVKLTLDNSTLLNSMVSTDYTINLAWSSGLINLSGDGHILNFTVPGYTLQEDYTIESSYDTSTVIIELDKDSYRVNISQSEGLISRD